MRLLLTGASGFIGRHVLARLGQYKDVQVTVLARQLDTEPVGITVIKGSIGDDALDWDTLGQPDVVLHLAWGGLPNYRSAHHFDEAYRHSTFLRKLSVQGLPRLICAGTCYEYGMRDGCLTEDMVTNPSNSYGLSKDMLRRQLELSLNRTQLLWARFFYLYGEGQASTSLYAQVQATITRGDRIFQMSGGEQLRDFLPIERAADYLVRLAVDSKQEGIFNITSGTPISIRRLVETWFAMADHPIELDLGHYPYPDWEPFAFWGSPVKLNTALEHI